MTTENPGFHAHDGWWFKREEDGSVRILAPDSLGPGASQRVDLDPSTWASIVASVSASGETGDRYRKALAFHGVPRAEQPGSPDCPIPESHGNPFRYCSCGWIEASPPA